jgi:hypothetical protein
LTTKALLVVVVVVAAVLHRATAERDCLLRTSQSQQLQAVAVVKVLSTQ